MLCDDRMQRYAANAFGVVGVVIVIGIIGDIRHDILVVDDNGNLAEHDCVVDVVSVIDDRLVIIIVITVIIIDNIDVDELGVGRSE
jgi:hypothetical protein